MLRKTVTVLLIFNAVSGMVGGLGLLVYPDGRLFQLPAEWLIHTPFSDFLIPGFILLSVNGILPVIVAKQLWQRKKYAPRWLWLQGVLSMGWILVQILMIQQLHFLQLLYGGLGFGFLLASHLIREKKHARHTAG